MTFPTRRIIEAASIVIGLDNQVRNPSSFFLMSFPDGREYIFADCALNRNPTSQELADIAIASAQTSDKLFKSTKVAMLSYSTGTSGLGPSVDLVRDATSIAGKKIIVDGPIQADAALVPKIADLKGSSSDGNSNVLIFPSLDAGNIAYKLCRELGGAKAIGPLLQGFTKPLCDLSRGASVEDIVSGTVIALALTVT